MKRARWFLRVIAILVLPVPCIGGPTVPSVILTGELGDGLTFAVGAEAGDSSAKQIQVLGDVNGDGRDDIAFLGSASYGEEGKNVSY